MKLEKTSSSGLGFTSVLQLIFIVLKLIGTIDWSWFWVFAPTWISLIIALIAIAVIFLFIND